MLQRPANVPNIVPWINWDEWTQVKQWIDNNETVRALDRLRTWQSRCELPVAIQATADLLACEQQHREQQEDTESTRLAYSMLIVRMVNGIVDKQQSGLHAQSVTDLAKRVNLPRILVDIRHDATHNALPSMELLKLALQLAREWLQSHYWHAQATHFDTIGKQLRDALVAYKTTMRKHKSGDTRKSVHALMKSVRVVAPGSEVLRTLFIPMLLSPAEKFALKLPKAQVEPTIDVVERVFIQCSTLWLPTLISFGKHFRLFFSNFLLAAARQLIATSSSSSSSSGSFGGDDDARRVNAWECSLLWRWIQELLRSQYPFTTGADIITLTTSATDDENDDDDDDDKKKKTDADDSIGYNIDNLPALAGDILRMCLQAPNHWTAQVAQVCLDIVLDACSHHQRRNNSNSGCCIYHQRASIIKALIAFHTDPNIHQKEQKKRKKRARSEQQQEEKEDGGGSGGGDDDETLMDLDNLCDQMDTTPLPSLSQSTTKTTTTTTTTSTPNLKWCRAPNWTRGLPLGVFVTYDREHHRYIDVTDDVASGIITSSLTSSSPEAAETTTTTVPLDNGATDDDEDVVMMGSTEQQQPQSLLNLQLY